MKDVKAIKQLKTIIAKIKNTDRDFEYIEIQSLFQKGLDIINNVDNKFREAVINNKDLPVKDLGNPDLQCDSIQAELTDEHFNIKWSRDSFEAKNNRYGSSIDAIGKPSILPKEASRRIRKINVIFRGDFYFENLDYGLDSIDASKALSGALHNMNRFDPDNLVIYPFLNVPLPKAWRKKRIENCIGY